MSSKRKKNTRITNHRGYQIDTMKDLLTQVLLYGSNPLILTVPKDCSITRLYCDSYTLLLRMQIKTITNENKSPIFLVHYECLYIPSVKINFAHQ